MSYKEIYEQAVKAKGVRDLTPKFVKFEKKGQSVIGLYKGSALIDSAMSEGQYSHYIFDTDDGLIKFHVGSATDKEISLQMEAGEIYRVEFLGKVSIGSGKTVNKFKVEHIDLSIVAEEPPIPQE